MFALTSRSRTFVPTDTSLDLISFFVTTRALSQALFEQRDARLEVRLLVLRPVVLRVSAMSPNSRASRMRSAISRRFSVDRN